MRIARIALAFSALAFASCSGDFVTLPSREPQQNEKEQWGPMTALVRDVATATPIAGARVQIGGVYAISGADGWVSLTVRTDITVPITVTRDGYKTIEMQDKFLPAANVRVYALTANSAPVF